MAAEVVISLMICQSIWWLTECFQCSIGYVLYVVTYVRKKAVLQKRHCSLTSQMKQYGCNIAKFNAKRHFKEKYCYTIIDILWMTEFSICSLNFDWTLPVLLCWIWYTWTPSDVFLVTDYMRYRYKRSRNWMSWYIIDNPKKLHILWKVSGWNTEKSKWTYDRSGVSP